MHQVMNLAVPEHDIFFFVFVGSEISNNQRYIRSNFILDNFKLKKRLIFLIVSDPFIFDQLVVLPA